MIFIRFILMALLFLCLPVHATTANEPSITWIDVRSVEEYDAGHIEGHANIPHQQIAQSIAELTTDKSAPIRLYCRSGRRSELAQQTLQAMGYTDVVNMGGYETVAAELEAAAETEALAQ
jgi:phage shock protein E